MSGSWVQDYRVELKQINKGENICKVEKQQSAKEQLIGNNRHDYLLHTRSREE